MAVSKTPSTTNRFGITRVSRSVLDSYDKSVDLILTSLPLGSSAGWSMRPVDPDEYIDRIHSSGQRFH